MKILKQAEIDEKLKLHKMWLNNEEGGKKADFSGVNLSHHAFEKVNLDKANFYGANLQNVRFESCTLQSTTFNAAEASWSKFRNTSLVDANFGNSILQNSEFYKCDLSGANFKSADLKSIIFENSELKNLNLDKSTLELQNIRADFDDKFVVDRMYELLTIVRNSKNVSEETREAFLKEDIVKLANKCNLVKNKGNVKIYM